MSEHHTPVSPFAPSAEQLDVWRIELTADMAEVKTMLHTLCGNGQPGTISKLESRVSSLETWKNRIAGAIAVVAMASGYVMRTIFMGAK